MVFIIMDPIDSILPLEGDRFVTEQKKETQALDSVFLSGKEGCGDTRRRAFSELFGGMQAFPPKYQTKREKDAIRQDDKIKKLLQDQKILEIRKVEGKYLVLTEDFQLAVNIKYGPCPMLGPANFELCPQEIQPR